MNDRYDLTERVSAALPESLKAELRASLPARGEITLVWCDDRRTHYELDTDPIPAPALITTPIELLAYYGYNPSHKYYPFLDGLDMLDHAVRHATGKRVSCMMSILGPALHCTRLDGEGRSGVMHFPFTFNEWTEHLDDLCCWFDEVAEDAS